MEVAQSFMWSYCFVPKLKIKSQTGTQTFLLGEFVGIYIHGGCQRIVTYLKLMLQDGRLSNTKCLFLIMHSIADKSYAERGAEDSNSKTCAP